MEFKTKDLMVTVLPHRTADLAKVCLFFTRICRYPTLCIGGTCLWRTCLLGTLDCGRSFGCGILNSCGRGGSACDYTDICPGSWDPFIIRELGDLVQIREELKNTLAQLDEIEKEGLPGAITTRAEAEAMEKSLEAALAEVKKAKGRLG